MAAHDGRSVGLLLLVQAEVAEDGLDEAGQEFALSLGDAGLALFDSAIERELRVLGGPVDPLAVDGLEAEQPLHQDDHALHVARLTRLRQGVLEPADDVPAPLDSAPVTPDGAQQHLTGPDVDLGRYSYFDLKKADGADS
jgi:hypothetical protein